MYIDITGYQDKGKTSLAVKLALALRYPNTPLIGNVFFHGIPNSTSLTIPELRVYFSRLVADEHRRETLIVDEVDRVFPHRLWHVRTQFETLLDAFQDEKLDLLIISTSHQGKGFDLMLREAVRLVMLPKINKFTGDTIVTWGFTDDILFGRFKVHVSDIFENYERWTPSK